MDKFTKPTGGCIKCAKCTHVRVCNALREVGYHASFAPYSENNIRTYRSVVKRWKEAVSLVKPHLEGAEN